VGGTGETMGGGEELHDQICISVYNVKDLMSLREPKEKNCTIRSVYQCISNRDEEASRREGR
jgi:hypothetical protein